MDEQVLKSFSVLFSFFYLSNIEKYWTKANLKILCHLLKALRYRNNLPVLFYFSGQLWSEFVDFWGSCKKKYLCLIEVPALILLLWKLHQRDIHYSHADLVLPLHPDATWRIPPIILSVKAYGQMEGDNAFPPVVVFCVWARDAAGSEPCERAPCCAANEQRVMSCLFVT